jgi:hypothetical protein
VPIKDTNPIGASRRTLSASEVLDFWNGQLRSNQWIRLPRIVDWLTAKNQAGGRIVSAIDTLTDQKRAAYLQLCQSIISGALHNDAELTLICVGTEWPLEGKSLDLPSSAAVTLQEFKDASQTTVSDGWIATPSDIDLFIRAYLHKMGLSAFCCRSWLINEGFDVPPWLRAAGSAGSTLISESPKGSPPSEVKGKPRTPVSKIEPTFLKWRAEQPEGYVPTAKQDVEHMKQHGVGRRTVRQLIKKFGGRKRGQKTAD